ncbi:ribosome maturation factor RimP [uncultured Anaerococcus sp.]|uniref:ribosome maturation factor RimP n=1 Tax=uncultured Anaerococcus sp. TaxID=293428 RepID=UPI0026108098|nr:ribosome maturation factor RimP [uncultured Anaerococcus sp.]
MDLITTLKETFEDDIKNLGYELIDIEFRTGKDGKILTFFIYSEDGINIDDCEKVSNFLDQKLDEVDLVKGQYYLEVSSPDLSRPLKTDRDLEISSNELLKVTLKNGEYFLAYIDQINEDSLVFSINEDEEIEVNRQDIKQIKIEIVF